MSTITTDFDWIWNDEAAFYIILFTVAGATLNAVVARLPGVPTNIIGGSPAWMTWMSMAYQLVYSGIMLGWAWPAAAVATGGTLAWGTAREWFAPDACAAAQPAPMLDPADPGKLWWERIFLYLMCGYMIKDLFQEMSPLIYAHHVACLAGVGIFLRGSCGGVAAVGTWVLEVGSFAYNAWVVRPESAAMRAFYVVVHTASNAFALYGMSLHMPSNGFAWGTFTPGGIFLAVAGPGLIAIRQWECYKNVTASGAGDATKAAAKKSD